MTIRRALALTLAALACAPGAATAAPQKRACHLIADPTGDTSSVAPDASLDAQLDITSADVATGKKYLTAVVRLDQLAKDDPANPQGRIYEFDFTAQEKNFILMGALLPGGSSFEVYISDTRFEEGQPGARSATGIGAAMGFLDLEHKEVRITAPLSVFDPYVRLTKNVGLYALVAFTYRAHGYSFQGGGQDLPVPVPATVTTGAGVGVDEAWGHKTFYRSQWPSCVKVS